MSSKPHNQNIQYPSYLYKGRVAQCAVASTAANWMPLWASAIIQYCTWVIRIAQRCFGLCNPWLEPHPLVTQNPKGKTWEDRVCLSFLPLLHYIHSLCLTKHAGVPFSNLCNYFVYYQVTMFTIVSRWNKKMFQEVCRTRFACRLRFSFLLHCRFYT